MSALFEPYAWSPEAVFSGQLVKPTYPPPQGRPGSGSRPQGVPITVEHHIYVPGRVRLQLARFANDRKDISWESSHNGRAWWSGLNGWSLSDLPLYFEDELLLALGAGEPIVLVESESSVDAFRARGTYATTWAGGAQNPPLGRLCSVLAGGVVIWIPDQDPVGLACSRKIESALRGACNLSTFTPAQGDARDALDALSPQEIIAQARPQ